MYIRSPVAQNIGKTGLFARCEEEQAMIKGVSHRVIEIRHPESVYFERAVLYLRPEAGEAALPDMHRDAEAILGKMTEKPGFRRLRGWVWFLLGAVCSGGAAMLAGWLR